MGLSPSKLHEAVFSKFLRNLQLETLAQHATGFWQNLLPASFYFPATSLLEESRFSGHYTLLISSSPEFLVAPIAKQLKVDEYKASCYALDGEGKMLSISLNVDGQYKLDYTFEVAKRLGISPNEIAAFTDSIWDLPLLEQVGHPIAVNPDKKLRKISKKMGWKII